MKKLLIILVLLIPFLGFSQESLSQLLKKHNSHNMPYISVEELAMPKTQAVILDAREFQEYEVSHLKNAVFVGFNTFDLKKVTSQLNNKQQLIVVYCSLGIRSETIAEKLKKVGYTKIYNLYGGIFEWKNKGFEVFDSSEIKTEKIHAYSSEWSKWLTSGEKVFN
ncbi:MAG: rhodanese-like domain-containing protein [Xanthomarina sp.]